MTPAQTNAAHSPAENLIIEAVAGSGKTRCLIERAAWMIENGIDSKGIALISYTVSASGEIQRRLIERLGKDCQFYFCGTLHGLCAKILRDAGRKVTVLSELETEEMVGEAILNSHYKGARKTLDTILKQGPKRFEFLPAKMTEVDTLALSIWRKMHQTNVMSYEALLYAGWKHLQKNSLKLEALFWDEAQDSAKIDFQIIELIEAKRKTIVADKSQSIFGFRGACPEQFEKLLKGAVKI